MKRALMIFSLMSVGNTMTITDPAEPARQERACSMCQVSPCCPTVNSLSLCNLCSDRINAGCLSVDENLTVGQQVCADRVVTRDLCVPSLSVDNICSTIIQTNNLCAERAAANQFCSQAANIKQLCTQRLSTQDLCVKGLIRSCSLFSSRVALGADISYPLGSVVPFDTILSDPNNNIHFSPTRYVTPESGIYGVTVQIVQQDIMGGGIIVGTPVGVIEYYVNGLLRRQSFAPYLSFVNRQSAQMTTLISLSAGDELTIRYKVLVVDENMGLVEYPGSVTLIGNSLGLLRSFMIVHYLSSDCNSLECPCELAPCQPCTVECAGCLDQDCTQCCS